MCCFSGNVRLVADTNIFARGSKEGRQFLVYGMHVNAAEDLAMILPLPVPKKSAEDAVRFVNLEKYPNFFTDLNFGFPLPPTTKAAGRSLVLGAKLKVVDVGGFEASFVPSISDFARLDERFRLPAEVWDQLPHYKAYGFAVFKLKHGDKRIHPMAFEFPRANPTTLFFPTVHIHDGKVHPQARFDHALYCQRARDEDFSLTDWMESPQPAKFFVKTELAQGLVDGAEHCYRKQLYGTHKNADIVV